MDRDLRILNNNKRDATRIVTRKPSDGEGSNGDIAVGNTAKGPMLFLKAKNRWKSLKPKSVPPKKDGIFPGSVQILPCRSESINVLAQTNRIWLQLGAGNTAAYDGSASFFKSTAHNPGGHWTDSALIARLLPHDTKIKTFVGKSIKDAESEHGGHQPKFISVEIFSLPSGEIDWDTNSANNYVQPFKLFLHPSPSGIINEGTRNASSSVDSDIQFFDTHRVQYDFEVDMNRIYPKGSFLAIHIIADSRRGTTGFTSSQLTYFTLHLEYHE